MAAEGNLRIEADRDGDRVVLRLSGELDLAGAPLLESEAENAQQDDPPAALVLDLRGLSFIDSTGLRAVLALSERCGEREQTFALVRGPHQVQRLMSMTRVAEHLRFIDSPEEILL